MSRSRALTLYQHQLAWAQARLGEVRRAWTEGRSAKSDVPLVIATDSMAIQLRMALESIAFATLVTNEAAYRKFRPSGHTDWHAKRILKAIAQANPNFYPWPFTISLVDSGAHFDAFEGPYLTQDRFEEAYDALGEMLHAPNPLNPKSDYRKRGSQIARWAELAEQLLQSHVVELPSVGFVFANLNAKTGECRVGLAEPMGGMPYHFRRPLPKTR